MDELLDQHLGLFDIPDDVTAEQAAAIIIERVRTENPTSWARPQLGY
jgi:hypothetical protein